MQEVAGSSPAGSTLEAASVRPIWTLPCLCTEDLGAESPRPFDDHASFRSLRGLAACGTCPPRSRPPLAVLAWLDHDHTTAEERGFGSLLVAVRRLFGALRSRG